MARMNLVRSFEKRRKYGKHFALMAVGMASFTLVGMFPGHQNVRHLFMPQPTKHEKQLHVFNSSPHHPKRTFDEYRIGAMPPLSTTISKLKTNNTSLTSARGVTANKKRNRDNDDRDGRLIFFLHVGIPKTATTFLQCSICKDYYSKGGDSDSTHGRHERFFLQDNLVYIGTCPCEPPSNNFVIHNHDAIFDHVITWDEQHELGPMPFYNASTIKNTGIIPKLSESFCTRIKQVHAQGRNAMMIFEGCHKFDQAHVEALAAFLNPFFRVHVILAYRRLFEWLPSKYNSINKPIGHGPIDDTWPGTNISVMQYGRKLNKTTPKTMPFALDRNDSFGQLVGDIETLQQHPAQIVRDNYARYFSQVEIIPLHDLPEPRGVKHNTTTTTTAATDSAFLTANPYLHHLFCSVIAARHVCQAIQQGQIRGSKEINPSVSLDYFRLAEAAHRQGWIPSHVTRSKATQLVQDKMQADKSAQMMSAQSSSDTNIQLQHLQCLPNPTLSRILNLSLATEAKMFGSQQAKKWRQGHQLAFEEYRSKNKYCWLDTAALLRLNDTANNDDNNTNNSDWMAFFKRLGH